jgi:Mrp family chromosome partitioning ATPase/capsular polysaccharide biosynthesis protein
MGCWHAKHARLALPTLSGISADIRFYGAALARRWTVIVPAIVLVPAAAMLLAVGQQKVYSASAEVLLTYSNPGANVNGLAATYPSVAPDRNVATQAALARNPTVARDALSLAQVRSSANDLLNHSNVSKVTSADVLDFSVTSSSPQLAMRLATNYAKAYTDYRNGIQSRAIASALAGVTLRLNQLASLGQAQTPIYAVLSRDQQRLAATQAAGTSDAVLVQPAQSAVQVGPHPARNAAVGLLVGIALAIALVFLMETLDTRVSLEEIRRRLRLPLLAAIPATRAPSRAMKQLGRKLLSAPRELIRRGSGSGPSPAPVDPDSPERALQTLAVLREPGGSAADAYRVLKSRLDLASLEHNFKSILLTSAQPYRAKSATAANLAVVAAQMGRRVLVCEFDSQRPSISDLFGLDGRPGLTDVVLRRTTLKKATVKMPRALLLSPVWTDGKSAENASQGTTVNGSPRRTTRSHARGMRGSLEILPFGESQPHSGFLGSPAVADLVEQLNSSPADLVLINAPPLLGSGESQLLSALADALIVALAGPVRPALLEELAATLARLPALPVGFITVGKGPVSGGSVFSSNSVEAVRRTSDVEPQPFRRSFPAERNGDMSAPHGVPTAL